MPIFSKYSGAGNDFAIVRAEEIGLGDARALARRICARRTGVGVDGLILVRSLDDAFARIRFFNPDGSEFATCGNGSRCAARYAVDRGLTGPELMLATDDGEVRARVSGEEVMLDYALDAEILDRFDLEIEGQDHSAWLVQMGTPHLVIAVDNVDVGDFEAVCQPLRRHPRLGGEGANVNLVSTATSPGARRRLRTFERGVEGETLACGSGCMATALALTNGELSGPRVEFETRSGTVLEVEFLPQGLIRLTGPAHHIFDGVLPDRTE